MGDKIFGRCEVCGKNGDLKRTYFRYPIKCECHNNSHVYYVEHHRDCTPKEPTWQNVTFKTETLQNPIPIAIDILRTSFKEGQEPGSYYDTWVANIACCIMNQYSDGEVDREKANNAAKAFIDLLMQE